ncbi:MAG: DUF551 domain-containing protein [Ghiorsea sp.]
MSEWISVDDRMPEDNQDVAFIAIFDEGNTHDYLNGRRLGGRYRSGKFGGFSFPSHSGILASHWMPLPSPPKEEDDE